MNRTIEIVVSPNGEIRIEAMNFRGPDCEKATRFLEEALGRELHRHKKPEHDRRNVQLRQQGVGS